MNTSNARVYSKGVTMKKIFTIVLSAVLAAGVGFLSVYFYESDFVQAKKVETSIVDNFDISNVDVNIDFIEPLSEDSFQSRLHQMTHQKVSADVKWGSIEITPESVAIMVALLERDGGKYKEEEYYWEVLNDWKVGNFSNAVHVHNTIWNWHNGTVGEAKRLFTPEEEEKFVLNNFR